MSVSKLLSIICFLCDSIVTVLWQCCDSIVTVKTSYVGWHSSSIVLRILYSNLYIYRYYKMFSIYFYGLYVYYRQNISFKNRYQLLAFSYNTLMSDTHACIGLAYIRSKTYAICSHQVVRLLVKAWPRQPPPPPPPTPIRTGMAHDGEIGPDSQPVATRVQPFKHSFVYKICIHTHL